MASNPVEIIKKAELSAEQLILDANSEKLKIMKAAQEAVSEYSQNSLKEAEANAQKLVTSALENSRKEKHGKLEHLGRELELLDTKANQNKSRAIKQIIDYLTTKN